MKVDEFFDPRRFDLTPLDNERAIIGANNPPGPIEQADVIIRALSDWMKDHPVIQTEEDARDAKPLIDRARAAQAEIETSRDREVRPLNDKVAEINAEHKAVHNKDPKGQPGRLDRVFNELKARLSAYLQAEEQRRLREAALARAAQEEAERLAREAEAKEHAALEEAQAGVVVDVAAVTEQANEAFATFERSSRFAERAEKDTRVAIGGGFSKSVSLRTAETLVVTDALKALVILGATDKICEAILTEARAYRKQNGKLPDGVSSQTERKL